MKKLLILAVLLAQAPLSVIATAADVAAAVAEEEPITKTLVWPDGTRYVGGVVDGQRAGKGTIFWQDGTRFVGQFENDMRNGPGTMILPDGTVYTGFFKNDELVDTEATIAASNAQGSVANAQGSVELGEQETVAALGDTNLPMEADSLSPESAETTQDEPLPQVDEDDLVETTAIEPDYPIVQDDPEDYPVVVAPEVVAVASTAEEEPEAIEDEPVEEPAAYETDYDTEPAETDTKVEEGLADSYSTAPYSTNISAVTETVKENLIETIDLWAAGWSDQNVPQYLNKYSQDFKVPGRQSRRTWEALRQTRLTRPRFIKLDVVYQRFEFVETNVVDVFFRQSYRSSSYSDLTDKVLRMRKEDNDWKILIERSR